MDAIAVAIRTQTPIYLAPKVADGFLPVSDQLNEDQQQELKKLINSNRTADTKKPIH